jgi:(heptosyl)LPS beta-1,4-glucosyltransferase
MRPTLSAVLAVRDEEQMLAGALRSLAFCDEIVVIVDDRTTDRTAEIARRYTDQVLVRRFEDFASSRNAGIEHATGDWILHVDADERITPELARELRGRLDAGTEALAFRAPTVNFFWGRRMEHGGWKDMMQTRIMRRDHATFSGRVHEEAALPHGRIDDLAGERWHFSHRSIEENLVKAVRYGRLEALDRHERGARRVTMVTLLRVFAVELGRRMVWRTGFRDGMPGFIEAMFQPFALFCSRVMLWELQRGDEIERRYDELERELGRDG